MFQDYLVDGNTCRQCKTRLVRVPQTHYPIDEFAPDDAIVCIDCGAVGSLPGVLFRGDGLVGGLLTSKQCAEIIAALPASMTLPSCA
jgi:hypothetical protein